MGSAACLFSLCLPLLISVVVNEAVSIRSAKSSNETVGNVALAVKKAKKILPAKGQPLIRKKLKKKKREMRKVVAKIDDKTQSRPKIQKVRKKVATMRQSRRSKLASVARKTQTAKKKPKPKKTRHSTTLKRGPSRLKKKTRQFMPSAKKTRKFTPNEKKIGELMPNDQPFNPQKVFPKKEIAKKESRVQENYKKENIKQKQDQKKRTKAELFMEYVPKEYAAYLNCLKYKEPTINKTYIEFHPGHIFRGIKDCRDETNTFMEAALDVMDENDGGKRAHWHQTQRDNYARYGKPGKCKQWRYGSDCIPGLH